jgi:hypothetical protein
LILLSNIDYKVTKIGGYLGNVGLYFFSDISDAQAEALSTRINADAAKLTSAMGI